MSSIVTRADRAAPDPAGERRLAVTLTREVTPVSPDHNLLVGFHFGTATNLNQHPAIVSPGLQPINGDDLYECWWHKGDVTFTTSGNVRIAQCDEYTVAILQQPDTIAADFRSCTYDAYHELLSVVYATDHRHLVKLWNYFGDINEGQEDREKYRQFSLGRASAFDELGIRDDMVPTGTAIGCVQSSELSIIALLTNNKFQSAENPRQVSAYRYPRQYGPRSPKFSRGGCVSSKDHDLFVISGTAAIIGHESVFPHDVARQTSETLTNLDHLAQALSELGTDDRKLVLDRECVLRVYLRDTQDLDIVARQLNDFFGGIEQNVVFLNADICRRELMIEIDGVRVLS
jgi:chorismate lyase/3-hydroxybenzoate synthase